MVTHDPMTSSPAAARTWLITGATGFIGRHLSRALQGRGDRVIVLTRQLKTAQDRLDGQIRAVTSLSKLPDDTVIDGIVNLAGAPILGMPWTQSRRRTLLASRIGTTQAVVQLCTRLRHTPRVLISGSAIGYYGVHGDEPLDESAAPQAVFQSRLCSEWEAAAMAAESIGVRVTCLRLGVVLGADGGALPRLALPMKLYGGTIPGSGLHWLSWIHIDDVVRLILFALDDDRCIGAVNATAPEPLTYGEFYRLLGRALHRPVWLRVPAWPLRAALGEMAQLLVDGQRVLPRRALELGFGFMHPTATEALHSIYGTGGH